MFSSFLKQPQYFSFWAFPPKRVFTLDRRHRLNCVRSADRLPSCFRHSEVLHLAFLNQFFHRSCHVFDWYLWVDAVLIKKIDSIHSQPFQ